MRLDTLVRVIGYGWRVLPIDTPTSILNTPQGIYPHQYIDAWFVAWKQHRGGGGVVGEWEKFVVLPKL